jgi:hypothetical protein
MIPVRDKPPLFASGDGTDAVWQDRSRQDSTGSFSSNDVLGDSSRCAFVFIPLRVSSPARTDALRCSPPEDFLFDSTREFSAAASAADILGSMPAAASSPPGRSRDLPGLAPPPAMPMAAPLPPQLAPPQLEFSTTDEDDD